MSESFGPKIILRGGMILRLLDSPRATHDLDYAFIGFDSKKQIVSPILNALSNYKQIKVEYSLHSTNVRFDIKLKNGNGLFYVVLEANVIKDCPSVVISTGQIAEKNHLEPKLILTMKHEIALSNKLAAWTERRLIRDLYDAYYYYRFVDVKPDIETLRRRLGKLNYADRSLKKRAPKSLMLDGFYDLLANELRSLNEKDIKTGLPNIETNLLPGLSIKIRSSLLELIDWMRSNKE
jgi:predicted nucleotidyltransferase component of viral defense system